MSLRDTLSSLKNTLTLQDPALRRSAREAGLLPAHTDYTRFIILGRSRTGSNFLRGLIQSNPAVVTFGEVFRNVDALDMDNAQYPNSPALLDLYQHDPLAFLEKAIYGKMPPEVHAVGFKLFYYHARQAPFDQLWPVLQADQHLHIIHIKRRNILKTHISRENAEKSGSWVNTSGTKEDPGPITVDYEACLTDFERTRQWEQEADLFFAGHPMLQVTYEDLAAQTVQSGQLIQQFLGLEPVPVQARTFRQSRKPLSEAIANYADLKRRFAGTPWAEFFSE